MTQQTLIRSIATCKSVKMLRGYTAMVNHITICYPLTINALKIHEHIIKKHEELNKHS